MMPVLPDKYNPFTRCQIYEKLKVSPYAGLGEIGEALKKISSESIPEEELKKKIASMTADLKRLKKNSTRVQLNSFILDKVDLKTVESRLKHLPNLKTEKIELPEAGVEQLFVEGRSMEIAEEDFNPVSDQPAMALDFDETQTLITQKDLENQVLFDI